MRSLIIILAACAVMALPSCNTGEGGSSDPGVSIVGFWSGTYTPDGGASQKVNVIFDTPGDDEEGAVLADVRFPFRFGVLPTCPEKLFQWSGTLKGATLKGHWYGLGVRDSMTVEMEFTDTNTGVGTYVVDATTGTCLGETGVILLDRFIE